LKRRGANGIADGIEIDFFLKQVKSNYIEKLRCDGWNNLNINYNTEGMNRLADSAMRVRSQTMVRLVNGPSHPDRDLSQDNSQNQSLKDFSRDSIF